MTAIERYNPPPNPVHADHWYMDRIEKMAASFARSNLCPEQFRGKANDIEIVAYSLADLGLRLSLNTLPQCYIVHGKPGYMAQLQSAAARRFGYDVDAIDSQCSMESATVRIVTPQGEIHDVTFTMDEAKKGGLTSNQVYAKFPKDMLIARATTRAIKRHAPEVMLGLSGTVDGIEIERVESPATAQEPDGIPAIEAKRRLLSAFDDLDKEVAKANASKLWQKYGLGKDPISQEQMNQLLSDAADTTEHEAKTLAEDDEIVDAEIIEDGEPFE